MRLVASIVSCLVWIVLVCLKSAAAMAATSTPEAVIEQWRRSDLHPLVGRMWIARDGRLIDGIGLSGAAGATSPMADALGIGSATFVLLGEVHDNAGHHLFRAGLIASLVEAAVRRRNPLPAIVTEHIRVEQVPALETFRQGMAPGSPVAVDAFFAALQWDKSGWPSSAMFRPLYEFALSAGLSIKAGDVARDRIRAAARGGIAALDPAEALRLGLSNDLPAALDHALADELRGSHCGMLPESAIGGMGLAQRYRDAHLAASMLDAVGDRGQAILLAGNGHVRADRGVPWHLRSLRPGASIVTVMLVEVADGRTDTLAYAPRDPEGMPAADAIVFTPRAQREDPCEKMRASMLKKN